MDWVNNAYPRTSDLGTPSRRRFDGILENKCRPTAKQFTFMCSKIILSHMKE
jgi:hypothetical protein